MSGFGKTIFSSEPPTRIPPCRYRSVLNVGFRDCSIGGRLTGMGREADIRPLCRQ